MKKPRNLSNAYCGMSLANDGPYIWLFCQGTTTERLSPSEAIKLGKRLIEMAKYVRSQK